MTAIKCFVIQCNGRGDFTRDGVPCDPTPGAMWFADWKQRKGPDGHHLIVCTPGGHWHVDGRASNCTRKDDDKHYCWVRHGEPPNITVDKNGDTCGCGCSIGQGEGYRDYHGFLRNGELVPAQMEALCPKCFGARALCKDQVGNDVPAPTSWLDNGTGSVRPIGSVACDRCGGSGIIIVRQLADVK